MKSIGKWIIVLITVLSLAGCIESNTVIKVNLDGSGEVEETFLMGTEMIQMIMGFAASPGEEGGSPPDLLDRPKLEQKALSMGDGVTLASAERISTDKSQGYRAVYRFSDITKLKVNQNPDENVPESPSEGGEDPTRELITFQFKKGTKTEPAVLTIINPPMETADEYAEPEQGEKAGSGPEQEEGMLEMFKMFFKDMRIDVSVDVNGKIVKSDATYVEGSKITLMEMDFSKIVENEGAFKKLALSKTESLEETKQVIASLPGIKVELKGRVEVQFK